VVVENLGARDAQPQLADPGQSTTLDPKMLPLGMCKSQSQRRAQKGVMTLPIPLLILPPLVYKDLIPEKWKTS